LTHNLASLEAALPEVPALALKARLTRRVEFLALVNYHPPNWLYTSGKAKRYNPAGVHCVYFGTDVDVTRAEYKQMWEGLTGADQPATEFIADVSLERVLDLTSHETLKVLKLTRADLLKNWRRATRLTLTQLLGLAVNETNYFSAILYASAVSDGTNVVIFRDRVSSPDYVKILGAKKKPLEQWP
jgi:RES domain-containing protein